MLLRSNVKMLKNAPNLPRADFLNAVELLKFANVVVEVAYFNF